uniref:ATP synthase complex subunit 8 n=1 Tax=Bostrichoidea sp. 4 KM-2017 TaxID=2219278 RepID=A0A346RII6_9COLE|nr:ATP synthase F0 subunit 8 [Bostrichoidea sp. 4 KM-2017]
MPQMAPLSWTLLFIYFSMIYMFINSINYYNFFYTPMKSFKLFKKKLINWKW